MTWTNPGVGSITSPYGPRKLAGAISDFHYGTDIGTKRSNVYAAQNGVVRTIWQTGKGAWVLDIRHPDEGGTQIRTRYIHMYRNEITVRVGQAVSAGQKVGNSGASGTGAAHLHFEVMVNGVNVDPQPFMAARGVNLGVDGGVTPAPTEPTQPVPPSIGKDDQMIRLARTNGDKTVWVGDGVTRRKINTPQELADVQWRISVGHFAGNTTVEIVDRIDWLGKAV